MRIRALATLVSLVVVAACNVSEEGDIHCYDGTACPTEYPVCSGASLGHPGTCTALAPGQTAPATGAVQITQLEGYPSTSSVVRGTVVVDVLARANSGVASVTLTVDGQAGALTPSGSSNGIYSFSVDTTKAAAPSGMLKLTAALVPGDGSAPPTPDTLELKYDNQLPSLTVASFGPADAMRGSVVVLALTASEALGSLSGAVTLGGVAVGAMAETPPSTASPLTYLLTYAVPESAAAGTYSIAVDATDLVGNAAPAGMAVPVQSFTVRTPFTLGALALTAPTTQEDGFSAGKTGDAITAVLSLTSTVPIGGAQPTFSLTDALGATRAFTGAVTAGTDGANTTWTISDAIAASDASGLAKIVATLIDPSGNSASASVALMIDQNAPEVSGLAVSALVVDALDANETVIATSSEPLSAAAVTTSNGDPGTCAIANGVDVTCTISLGSVASATVVTATLTLTDLVGNATAGGSAFQIAYTLVPAPDGLSLTSSAAAITLGTSASLLATFTGGTADINGTRVQSGQALTVAPAATTLYTLNVTNGAGHLDSSKSTTVAVVAAPAITSLTASSAVASPGDTRTLLVQAAGVAAGTYLGALAMSGCGTGTTDVTVGATGVASVNVTIPSISGSTAQSCVFTLTLPNGATTPATAALAASITVYPLPAATSLTAAATTLATGGSTALTAVYVTDASGSAVVTGSDGSTVSLPSGNQSSGTSITVAPSATTTYTLTVANGAGHAASASPTALINVVAPASFGSGSFAITTPSNAMVTGGTSVSTLGFSIPAFGASVTSAAMTDSSGNAVLDGSGNAITSAAILAAGSGATALVVAMPLTASTDDDTLTYTLTASNAAGSAKTTCALTVVPVPTDVGLFTGNNILTSGAAATLTASAFTGGTGVVTPGNIPIDSGGSIFVAPISNTTYVLTVTSPAGDAQGTVTAQQPIGVVQPVSLTGTLSITPSVITVGTASISATAPVFSASVASAHVEIDDKNGSRVSNTSISSGATLSLNTASLTTASEPYSVVLNVLNDALPPSTAVQSVALTVVGSPGAFSGSTFAVSPSSVSPGDEDSLSFTIPTFGANVTTALLTGDGRSLAVTSAESGVTLPIPTETTTYVLTPYNAAGLAGTTASATVTLTPSISSFTATSLEDGTSGTVIHVKLAGKGSNVLTFVCSYLPTTATVSFSSPVTVSGSGSATNGTCGSAGALPMVTTTYTMTVTSGGSAVTRSIEVIADPSIGLYSVSGGSGQHFAIGSTPSLGYAILNGVGTVSVSSASGGSSGDSGAPYSAGTGNELHSGSITLAPQGTGNGTEAALTYTLTVAGSAGTNNASSPSATSTQTLYIDPGSWSSLASGGAITPRFGATVTAMSNNKVLIAGGCTDATCSAAPLSSAIVCDSTGACAAVGGTHTNMVHGRAFAQAVALSGGKVLITGGYTASNKGSPTATSELYDPSVDSFANTGLISMQTARAEHTLTLMPNGDVLAIGGFTSGGGATNKADRYSSTASSNTAITSMGGDARAQHTATLLASASTNGTLVLAGGSGDTTTELCTFTGTDCTWTAGGTMTEAKSLHSATVLSQGVNAGRILLCGGLVGGSPSANCALSNSAGSSFAAVTALGTARSSLAAIEIPLLPGKVLLCGGNSASTSLSACDVEDTTGTAGSTSLLATQSLVDARASFGLAAFSSGVVFAGGGDVSTSSVEAYDSN